jgi:hypothetical protein
VTLNAAAMQLLATDLQAVIGYGQLHTGPAGSSGTANLTTAARQPVQWSAPNTAGSFSLVYLVVFGGGAANGPVYSLTLWNLASGGACYGEFPLTGDTKFNASGVYQVTALDFTGTAT